VLIVASRVKGIALEQQTLRIRPNDVPVMRCDASKVEQAIGWRPEIPIEQTLLDLLNDWRGAIISYVIPCVDDDDRSGPTSAVVGDSPQAGSTGDRQRQGFLGGADRHDALA